MEFMFLNTGFLLTVFDYIVILCTYIILIQKNLSKLEKVPG